MHGSPSPSLFQEIEMSKAWIMLSLLAVAACSSESPVEPDISPSFAASDNANSLRVETFEVVAPTSCNSYTNGAFTLGFALGGVVSPDCTVGVAGPVGGLAGGVVAPNVEGDAAGVLRIDFDKPTRTVEFD